MTVGELMQKDVITVTKKDSFRHAMNLIRQQGIRHLPVVEGKRLVGIVTDRDIRQASPSGATSLEIHELHYLLEKITVADIMSKKVVSVAPSDDVKDAAKLLLKHKIGGLPVVRGDTLLGIVTETDILRAYAEQK
jgi:acetoin utilization protein AcuB